MRIPGRWRLLCIGLLIYDVGEHKQSNNKAKAFPALQSLSLPAKTAKVFAKITVTDVLECGLNFRDNFSVGIMCEIVWTVTS